MAERDRIRAAYARREARGLDSRYGYWEPANLLTFQERERAVLDLLRDRHLLPLEDARVLDVGCGTGALLRDFLRYGARPENLTGVDLIPQRIGLAAKMAPNFSYVVGDGSFLPFASSVFHVVTAFTLFSSIRDAGLRHEVAREIVRVLHPDGVILWYDFWINPFNRDVRSMRKAEISRLFPGFQVRARRITLALPIARWLAPRSRTACRVLSAAPFLRTHWIAAISPVAARSGVTGPNGSLREARR